MTESKLYVYATGGAAGECHETDELDVITVPWSHLEGSIIHGTLRFEDIIPALLSFLEIVDPTKAMQRKGEYCQESYICSGICFDGNAKWIWEEHDDLATHESSAIREMLDVFPEVIDELCNDIQERLPEHLTICNHPGDGSDLGIWKTEMINEDG